MKNCRGGMLLLIGIVIAGCAVHTPEVTFTSERTALEKQILGSYRMIEEDTWELSSVRGAGRDSRSISADRLEAIEAVAGRLFNADDIEDFKRDEVIGENASGSLSLRPTPKLLEDASYLALVNRIVAEENRDRPRDLESRGEDEEDPEDPFLAQVLAYHRSVDQARRRDRSSLKQRMFCHHRRRHRRCRRRHHR